VNTFPQLIVPLLPQDNKEGSPSTGAPLPTADVIRKMILALLHDCRCKSEETQEPVVPNDAQLADEQHE
jgi:hypothetical protein